MTETPKHESPPDAWWKKASRGFVNWLKGTTTRWNVIVGFIFVGLGFLFVVDQLEALNHDAIEQSRFQSDLANYGRAVADYQLCVRSVELGDANRSQWQLAVEQIRAIGGDSLADILAGGPLLQARPRTIDDCIDPGQPPPIPN